MPYLIKRTDQGGGYVSRPGSLHSYTQKLEHARVYKTREQALADRCPGGGEIIICTDDIFYHQS